MGVGVVAVAGMAGGEGVALAVAVAWVAGVAAAGVVAGAVAEVVLDNQEHECRA